MQHSQKKLDPRSPLEKAGFNVLRGYELGKLFIKSVAVVLIFTFSCQQLVWAVDVRQMLASAKSSFEEDQGSSLPAGSSVESFEESQAIQQSVVDNQQALQDLQNLNFSLTTQNGDILKYVGNTLKEVVRPDGTILNNIDVGVNGEILNADLRLSDGSIQLYQNGEVIAYETPDGTQVFYENGLTQKTISKDNIETVYFYTKDSNHVVIETILENPTHKLFYDAQGKLKKSFDKTSLLTTVFQNGIPLEIQRPDGLRILFEAPDDGTDKIVTQGTRLIDAAGNQYYFTDDTIQKVVTNSGQVIDSIVLGSDGTISDATLKDTNNTTYTYQSKKLTGSVDSEGFEYRYDYTPDQLYISNPDKGTRVYDTQGALSGWKTKEITPEGQILNFHYILNEYDEVQSASVSTQSVDSRSETLITSNGNESYVRDPEFKFNILFSLTQENPSVEVKATYRTTHALLLHLTPGEDSSYDFNGQNYSLNTLLEEGIGYTAQVIWRPEGVSIYVYDANTQRPETPQGFIEDARWSPEFNIHAINSRIDFTPGSNLRRRYETTSRVVDLAEFTASSGFTARSDFRFNEEDSQNQANFNITQVMPNGLKRIYTLEYRSRRWKIIQQDEVSGIPGKFRSRTLANVRQTLEGGVDYTGEFRYDETGTKLLFYIYEKTSQRPEEPIIWFSPEDGSDRQFTADFINAHSDGSLLIDETPVEASSLDGRYMSEYTGRLENLSYKHAPGFLGQIPTPSFKEARYSKEGILKEATLQDDTRLLFDEEGLLSKAYDADGHETSFDFTPGDLSNLIGTEIKQESGGVSSVFDAEGRLSSVQVGDLTIYYKEDQTTIDFIKKSDDTEIYDVAFYDEGGIKDATVITPDGEERVYVSEKLVSITRPDYTKLFYVDEELTTLITPEEFTYSFDYTNPGIIEATLTSPGVPDALTPIEMEYDTDFNLKKVIRQNNEIISYLNGTVQKIETPGDDPKVFDYVRDSSGKLIQYTVSQGNTNTFYDANNQVTKTIITPSTDNPHTLDISYQYGKIREINKDGVLTFKYSYTFDSNQEEITNIEDLEEKSLKVYKAGNLLTSLDTGKSVLSTYSYSNDKVLKVEVTRLGRTLHTYDYSYVNDLTVVTDEENVKRTYDANKKLLELEKDNKTFGYTYNTTAGGDEIISESFLRQTLKDDSVVLYDTTGQVDSIILPGGAMITDVVLDANRALQKATVTDIQGKKFVFNATSILEEIETDGTHYYFDNNKLSKVTKPGAKDLHYSYSLDTNGAVTAVWVKADNANLKYDITGNLLGLKRDGFLTPDEARQATTHLYEGGTDGAKSIDGDFDTAQYWTVSRSLDRSQEGQTVEVKSTHTFPSPQAIIGIQFRAYTYGSGWGDYSNNNHSGGSYAIEYQQGTDAWVPAATGGMGDSGQIALTTNITGITAIRVYASGFGAGSDHGGYNAGAYIYEIQYTIADQSYLAFSQVKDAQNNITGYKFSGYPGTISFNPQGMLLAGTPAALSGSAQFLDGQIVALVDKPYFTKITAPSLPSVWAIPAQDAILDGQSIVTQEYSSDGILETQTKADKTTTTFENNKPYRVFDEKGVLLMEYSYDANGDISGVSLKNARDALPGEVSKAKQKIEEGRAQSLQALAAQKSLVYESIQSQFAVQKNTLYGQLSSLESQYNSIAGTDAHGKKAKNARGDALNQVGSAMAQVRGALAQISAEEANAYAALDGQVKTLSDQIEADSQTAFTELANQEANLKKEILRQEVSPIVYDYYRRILGRDPASAEYDHWINKLDYSSGEIILQDIINTIIHPGASFTLNSGSYLSISDNPTDWSFGTENFTIDFWTKINQFPTFYTPFFQPGENFNSPYSLGYLPTVSSLYFRNGGTYQIPWSPLSGIWYHIALVRSSGVDKIFINGTQIGSDIQSSSNLDTTLPLLVGKASFGIAGVHYLNGSMDQFRITKGIARWASNFNPPTETYTADSNTALLLRSDPSDPVILKDLSAKNHLISINGDVSKDTTDYKVSRTEITHTYITQEVTKTLSDYLNALPELSERQTYVSTIKNGIRQMIQQYLAMTDSSKAGLISTFGLTQAELIDLTYADAQKILAWLDSRSLHFGQSAFLALESLLDQKGIIYTRTDLAVQCILIDILTGVISPLDDGDLVISMHALNKIAAHYGLILSGANLSWEDLLAIYQANPTTRIIAHINGNHYVVITGITSDTITYIDPGAGPDKQNQVETIAKADFMKGWKGNVTAESSLLNPVVTASAQKPVPTARLLSQDETQKIRGAFFFFLIPAIIGAISSIGGAVASVLAGIGAIIGSIGSLVGTVLSGVGQLLGAVLNGIGYIGNAIWQGISFAASSLWGALGNVGSFLSQNVFGSIAKASFGNTLFENVVRTGLNFAITKGLDGLGVNPAITNVISAFVSGGSISGFSAGTFSIGNFLNGGIRAAFQAGGTTIIDSAGLDAPAWNIVNFFADPGTDGIFSGTVNGTFFDVGQKLLTSLTTFGIEKLGQIAGLDPRIATLIASPISGAIGGALADGFNFGQDIVNIVNQSIQSGFVAVGTQFLVDRLPDNLGGSFLTSVLSSAFNKLINPTSPTNIVDAVWGSLTDLGQKLFSPDNLNRLVQAVTSNGLVDGLERYAQDIFERSTIESFVQAGGTIASFVQTRLASAVDTLFKGQQAKKVDLSTGGKDVELFYREGPDGVKLLGYLEDDNYVDTSNSGPTLLSADISKYYDGDTVLTQVVENGAMTSWQIRDRSSNEILLEVTPETAGNYGSIQNFFLGSTLTFNEGNIVDIKIEAPDGQFFQEDTFDLQNLTDQEKKLIVSYHLLSGIGNKNQEGITDVSINEFKLGLVNRGVDQKYVHLTPIFEGDQRLRDIGEWIDDASGLNEGLTEEVRTKLRQQFDNLSPEERTARQVAITYSGSANPTLKAIARDSNIAVDTVISWGGPILNPPTDFSGNSRFKQFINVWGSDDPFKLSGTVGQHTLTASGIQSINIEILGASHTDFWYSDAKWADVQYGGKTAEQAAQLKAKDQEINRKTTDFLHTLAIQVGPGSSATDLSQFLNRKGIELKNGVYYVNLDEIENG